MPIKNVTATRMTLLSLKKQLLLAVRGHKLLKDKQDGLMQEFLKIIKKARILRESVEKAVKLANNAFLEAQSLIPKPLLENALAIPSRELLLKIRTKNVMSVRIPKFELEIKKLSAGFGYGNFQTRSELDIAILKFLDVFNLLISLAEIEKSAENLAEEIEKTRRRVNALEYRLIPDLQDTLKFIQMKLAEAERSVVVQTMAIKAMIEKNELISQK